MGHSGLERILADTERSYRERGDCAECIMRNGMDPSVEIKRATHEGVCLYYEMLLPMCDEHLDEITNAFPETLRKLDKS